MYLWLVLHVAKKWLVEGHACRFKALWLSCNNVCSSASPPGCSFVQESASLQQELSAGEARLAETQEEAARLACEAAAVARARDASATAMQSAAEEQAAAGAECARMTRLVSQCEVGAREAADASASARAAAHSTSEVHALASAAVQKWRSKVQAVARELSACHRSQQPAVAARLCEARQRLDQHQQQAAAAADTLPALQAEARSAEQAARQAQETLAAISEQLVEKAEQQARAQQRMAAAAERHEQAAVAAMAAEQAAAAAAQEHRLLSSQQQLRAGRLRQLAQQVLHRQQAAWAMQQRVGALQQAHKRAVSAAVATGKFKRRALDVQLAAAAGSGAATAGSPEPRRPLRPATEQKQSEAKSDWWEQSLLHDLRQPEQQPHPQQRPPLSLPQQASPGSSQTSDGPSTSVGGMEEQQGSGCEPCGALVLAVQMSDWSCLSSAVPSPRPAPIAQHSLCSAADLFFRQARLRRAFALLRSEAQHARIQLAEAAHWYVQRCLVACFREWRLEAEEQAAWLARASLALRRSSVLRQWAAAARLRAWLREAEAAADVHRRRVLLRAALVVLRQHMEHQRWRDEVHEAVVLLRLRNMLCAWRVWVRLHRMEVERGRRASALHHAHMLRAAWRQWRWYAHGRVSQCNAGGC